MKVTGSGEAEATSSIDTISIADEIEKLSKLKQKGKRVNLNFRK